MSPSSTPPSEQQQEKERIRLTAELMQRGAVLLRESCPRCGSLQLRYKDRVICTKEDDISDLESLEAGPHRTLSNATPSESSREVLDNSLVKASTLVGSAEDADLATILRSRLRDAALTLAAEPSVERQRQILDLIIKYLEAIERLR